MSKFKTEVTNKLDQVSREIRDLHLRMTEAEKRYGQCAANDRSYKESHEQVLKQLSHQSVKEQELDTLISSVNVKVNNKLKESEESLDALDKKIASLRGANTLETDKLKGQILDLSIVLKELKEQLEVVKKENQELKDELQAVKKSKSKASASASASAKETKSKTTKKE